MKHVRLRPGWPTFCQFLLGVLAALAAVTTAPGADRPNILLIYADDLGFGDIGAYGATRVKTPNLDRLGQEGLRFTDAHSPAATCTPSRYALLTGQYAWRKKGTGVLPGDAALILDPGRITLPAMLRRAGYRTGVVGKWHLGLGPGPGKTDWNGEIRPGPLEVGFDESFILPATGDRVPCVYVEGHRVFGLDPTDPLRVSFAGPVGDEPTGKDRPDLLRLHPSHGHDMTIVGGISRIGYMSGGRAARWNDEDMADVLSRRAVRFIEESRGRDRPFFLYFATHDIHVPRAPHARFQGRSEMGPRGDVIAQFDDSVGAVLAALDRTGQATNTLVIFSSDNGPVVDDGYRDDAVARLGDHRPAGGWRGGKYSAFEGGTRVPMIVRWPGRVRPGTATDALVCHVDFLASFASLTGQSLGREETADSENVLPALLGDQPRGRRQLVEHAGVLALREGSWKYIEPGRGAAFWKETSTETGQDPNGHLYNLATDPAESADQVATETERARQMQRTLDTLRNPNSGQP